MARKDVEIIIYNRKTGKEVTMALGEISEEVQAVILSIEEDGEFKFLGVRVDEATANSLKKKE